MNPNTSEKVTERLRKAAERMVSQEMEVVGRQVSFGPPEITTELDELVSQVAVLEYLDRHAAGYDGVIVGCFGDPGVRLAKERYPVPVLGIAESAYHMAGLTGERFSVISTGGPEESVLTWNMIDRCGLRSKCQAVHPLGLDLLEVSEASLPRIEEAVGKIAAEDGVQSVVLACAALAGMGEEPARKHGIPILDGVQQAAMLLDGMLRTRYPEKVNPRRRAPDPPVEFPFCFRG